ncbi:MAG: hypothetical protein P8J89_03615 [Phycisphaerales bacterium]|nr:hypothetical protein [Phycisphaerales bacterium]
MKTTFIMPSSRKPEIVVLRSSHEASDGTRPSFSVALGDLDEDGDLDTWIANDGDPNTV